MQRSGSDLAALRATIARLNGLGWTDCEIADRLDCAVSTVGRHRRALGLSMNVNSPRHRQRIQRGQRRWLKREGYRSFAQLRQDTLRARVARFGWPAGATPREVTILEALRSTPLTTRELAAVIGLGYEPADCSWTLRVATRMARRGWLLRGRRGHGRIFKLAAAVLGARRRWEEMRRCR